MLEVAKDFKGADQARLKVFWKILKGRIMFNIVNGITKSWQVEQVIIDRIKPTRFFSVFQTIVEKIEYFEFSLPLNQSHKKEQLFPVTIF